MPNTPISRYLCVFLKALYFVACGIILNDFFQHPEHWINPEVVLLFTVKMLIIGFPPSIIIWVATWGLGLLLSSYLNWQVIELFVFFSGVVAIGYWQWFVFIPYIWKRILKNWLFRTSRSNPNI